MSNPKNILFLPTPEHLLQIDIVSTQITDVMINMFHQVIKEKGIIFVTEVRIATIGKLIAGIAYDTLASATGKKYSTDEKAAKALLEDYSMIKGRIQEVIGAGMSSAIQTFTGKGIEYYCQIKIIPEPSSVLPS